MNLTPQWRPHLERAGHEVRHWSEIGAYNAPDTTRMEWARQNDYIVFTHDLDYGALLYLTGATAPSVIQVRGADVRPTALLGSILNALLEAEDALAAGALVTVDVIRHRISVLPLGIRTEKPGC
jgi:predicted nuclease of predicted toxin-antitoxin system